MALIVGIDTYITIAEATEYVSKHYISTDPLRVQWEHTSEEDQEVMLRRSFEQINSLPYIGKPKNPKQTLPFPRAHNFEATDMQKVKNAQAEQALGLSDTVTSQETEDRIKLRRAGVTQYKIGDLSEKFQDGLPVDSNANFYGLSEKSYVYLKKWLQGGYRVCTSTRRHCGYPWPWLL